MTDHPQQQQQIIFTRGGPVVITGIPKSRRAICEEGLRTLEYVAVDRVVRFEDLPVEDTPIISG